MTLNNLQPAPGAYKARKRKGRGQGNGKGKTAGKGHKGWHARTGAGLTPGFQGGQSPLYRRIPKFGFTNKHAREIKPLNLAKLQQFIDEGRIDASSVITMKTLYDVGIVTKVKDGVKLLGKGAEHFSARVDIEVAQASASAIEAVERNGGSLTTVFYNKLGLRALTQPHKFDELPRFALPKPKLMPYYTDYKNRGYLSTEMQLRRAGLQHLLPGSKPGKGAESAGTAAE